MSKPQGSWRHLQQHQHLVVCKSLSKINSRVRIQLQDALDLKRHTSRFSRTTRDVVYRLSGKDIDCALYEITGGKDVGWDDQSYSKRNEEGGGNNDFETHLTCQQRLVNEKGSASKVVTFIWVRFRAPAGSYNDQDGALRVGVLTQ